MNKIISWAKTTNNVKFNLKKHEKMQRQGFGQSYLVLQLGLQRNFCNMPWKVAKLAPFFYKLANEKSDWPSLNKTCQNWPAFSKMANLKNDWPIGFSTCQIRVIWP